MNINDNIPEGCRPFDLEAAKRGEPIVTRDGEGCKVHRPRS